jgi:cyclic pyranopterin phosphate synthase
MNKLTHTNEEGKARMVDVSGKSDQLRIAKASGHISLGKDTIKLIKDNQMKKGDVLTLAEVAGIQAAKKTHELIPLCHNIGLNKVAVIASIDKTGVRIEAESKSTGKTGVEMEALTAVSVGLLTVYDMCKAVDKSMLINNIGLIEKTKHDIT